MQGVLIMLFESPVRLQYPVDGYYAGVLVYVDVA
jgi:hypothetical protein